MLNISQHSTIYLFVPHQATSGGPETLHQLCHGVNQQGGDCRIIYTTS